MKFTNEKRTHFGPKDYLLDYCVYCTELLVSNLEDVPIGSKRTYTLLAINPFQSVKITLINKPTCFSVLCLVPVAVMCVCVVDEEEKRANGEREKCREGEFLVGPFGCKE